MEEIDPGDEEYWNMEDFKEYSKPYERNSKLSWIWRKGVNLGKKMVVTGVVVSSAPFVLPPLVALSAIGFAFSVPAGFVFATYACGEKLMDTLLPMPSSPSFEQYESMSSSDEEEYRVYTNDVDEGYEEDEDISVEEKEFERDTKKEIEMRIELVEENNKELDAYDQTPLDKDELDIRSSKVNEVVEERGYEEDVEEDEEDTKKEIEMRIELVEESNKELDAYDQTPLNKDELDIRSSKVNEMVEERGYEEDVEEYLEDEEQIALDSKAIPDILEGIQEAEDEIAVMKKEETGMPRDSLRAVVVEAQVGGENDDDVEQVTEGMAFVPPKEIVGENEYKEKFSGIEEGELKSETTGLIEELRDEGRNDQEREDSPAKETAEEFEEAGRVPEKSMYQDMGNTNLPFIPEEVEPALDDKDVMNGLKGDDYISFEGEENGLMHDEPKSAVDNQLVVNVKIDGDRTITEVHQGTGSNKLGTLIFPNEVAMEMSNESGSDMYNNGTVAPDQISDSSVNMPEGEDLSLNNMVEVTVDYHEVVIESTMPVSEHAEAVPEQAVAAVPIKVKVEEEKVWEQINALRTIVGCSNTPHTSYAEELKALYVFTGVEPPASSKDPADLADINEKLYFLKSIVGVK